MDLGAFRQRVSLQRREEVRDGDGDLVTIGWVTLYPSMPAQIEPLSARDMRAAAVDQSEVSAKVTIQFTPELFAYKSMLRAVRLDDGRVYDLSAPIEDNVNGRSWLTFNASQGVTEG